MDWRGMKVEAGRPVRRLFQRCRRETVVAVEVGKHLKENDYKLH